MKNLLYLLLASSCLLFSTSVQAAKPDGVGKGKADKQMSAALKEDAMDKKSDEAKAQVKEKAEAAKKKAKMADDKAEDQKKKARDKAEEAKDKAKTGSDASDKTDAVRKEAGKGSETGQAKREENSRKWWKFWGD